MRFGMQRLFRAEEGGAGSAGDEGGVGEGAKPAGKEEGAAGGEDAGDEGEKSKTVLGRDAETEKKESSGEGDDSGEKKSDEEDGKGSDEGEGGEGGKPGEFDVSAFEVPEGTTIDEGWLGKLVETPAIQKLDQAEVQGLIGMVGEWSAEQVAQSENARVEAQNTQTATWLAEAEAHEYVVENGGLEALSPAIRAARDAYFDTPELRAEFDKSGFGNHPAMLVGMAKVAKDLGLLESELPGGGKSISGTSKKSAAHRLFSDYVPGEKHDADRASG